MCLHLVTLSKQVGNLMLELIEIDWFQAFRSYLSRVNSFSHGNYFRVELQSRCMQIIRNELIRRNSSCPGSKQAIGRKRPIQRVALRSGFALTWRKYEWSDLPKLLTNMSKTKGNCTRIRRICAARFNEHFSRQRGYFTRNKSVNKALTSHSRILTLKMKTPTPKAMALKTPPSGADWAVEQLRNGAPSPYRHSQFRPLSWPRASSIPANLESL